MFFIGIFGVENKDKYLGAYSNAVCPSCGGMASYRVHKSYTYLHVFFIPTFRWNIRYYVKASCCGSLYELSPAAGKRFEKNSGAEIAAEDLRRVDYRPPFKHCPNCRVDVPDEYSFCPYCGGRL